MSAEGASYRDAGVDYDALDSAKRLAMLGALSTSALLGARGGRALDASRGEPAFVFELGERTLALVLEGLGTKSMIARAVLEQQGVNRFADVAYDAVAAILNDLACVGALPLVVNAYFATGDSALVRAPGALDGAAGGLAPGLRGRRLRVGRGGVAVAAGDARRRRRSSSPGAAVGVAARGRGADPRRRAGRRRRDRAGGFERPARKRRLAGAAAGRAPAGGLRHVRCPSGRSFGEALLDPIGHVRGAGGRAAAARRAGQLPQPRHRSRAAEADAPERRLHVPHHGPARGTCRCSPFSPPEAGMDAAEAYSTLNMGVGYAVYCARRAGRRGARGRRATSVWRRCSAGTSRTVRGG